MNPINPGNYATNAKDAKTKTQQEVASIRVYCDAHAASDENQAFTTYQSI